MATMTTTTTTTATYNRRNKHVRVVSCCNTWWIKQWSLCGVPCCCCIPAGVGAFIATAAAVLRRTAGFPSPF